MTCWAAATICCRGRRGTDRRRTHTSTSHLQGSHHLSQLFTRHAVHHIFWNIPRPSRDCHAIVSLPCGCRMEGLGDAGGAISASHLVLLHVSVKSSIGCRMPCWWCCCPEAPASDSLCENIAVLCTECLVLPFQEETMPSRQTAFCGAKNDYPQ